MIDVPFLVGVSAPASEQTTGREGLHVQVSAPTPPSGTGEFSGWDLERSSPSPWRGSVSEPARGSRRSPRRKFHGRDRRGDTPSPRRPPPIGKRHLFGRLPEISRRLTRQPSRTGAALAEPESTSDRRRLPRARCGEALSVAMDTRRLARVGEARVHGLRVRPIPRRLERPWHPVVGFRLHLELPAPARPGRRPAALGGW